MCGCFVVALGAFFPRVALILIWIFNWPFVLRPFESQWILPAIGVVVLPYTTLVYVLLWNWLNGVNGFAWFFVVLAFLVDIGAWVGGARSRAPQSAE